MVTAVVLTAGHPTTHSKPDIPLKGSEARLHDGARASSRVAALEDAASHKHAVHAHLHHQRRVSRRRHAARRKVHHRQPPQRLCLQDTDGNRKANALLFGQTFLLVPAHPQTVLHCTLMRFALISKSTHLQKPKAIKHMLLAQAALRW